MLLLPPAVFYLFLRPGPKVYFFLKKYFFKYRLKSGLRIC